MKRKIYHYTDIGSLEKILASNSLKASVNQNSDCALGRGVYFTTMAPNSYSADEIFYNNWARDMNDTDLPRMHVCIEVHYEGKNLFNDPGQVNGRDVWLYVGEDMTDLATRIASIYISPKATRSDSLRDWLKETRARVCDLTYRPRACASPTPKSSSSSSSSSSSNGNSGFWGVVGAVGLIGIGLGAAAVAFSAASSSSSQLDLLDDDDDDDDE